MPPDKGDFIMIQSYRCPYCGKISTVDLLIEYDRLDISRFRCEHCDRHSEIRLIKLGETKYRIVVWDDKTWRSFGKYLQNTERGNLESERQLGVFLAKELVVHLKVMSAEQLGIPVEIDVILQPVLLEVIAPGI